MGNMNDKDRNLNKPTDNKPGAGGGSKPEIQPDFTPAEREQPKSK